MNIERVCKNVGHDGSSFFCMLCGKAGYTTKEQAMGHLAKCKSRMSVLASQPASQLPSQSATYNLAELPTKLPTKLPLDMSAIEHLLSVQGQEIADIKQYQARMSNEVPHLQAVGQMQFLGVSADGWIIIAVIGIVAYSLGREHCSCDYSDYKNNRHPRNGGSGFGSNMAGKIAGKFIDKIF
jgi:hypothetical protein